MFTCEWPVTIENRPKSGVRGFIRRKSLLESLGKTGIRVEGQSRLYRAGRHNTHQLSFLSLHFAEPHPKTRKWRTQCHHCRSERERRLSLITFEALPAFCGEFGRVKRVESSNGLEVQGKQWFLPLCAPRSSPCRFRHRLEHIADLQRI